MDLLNLFVMIEGRRRQKNWTLEALSAVTRISISHLSHIERGDVIPTVEQLERLAVALDLRPQDLLRPVPDLTKAYTDEPVAEETTA